MSRRAASIFLGFVLAGAPACKTALSDAPRLRADGAPVRIGTGIHARGEASGNAILFPAASAGGRALLWSASGEASPVPAPAARERASDGGLLSYQRTDGRASASIPGAGPHRRLLASFGGGAPAAVSPEGEVVESFDLLERPDALVLVWLARNDLERPVRFARLDGSSAPRVGRVPFESSRPYAESPAVAAIGPAQEGAFLVAFTAAARAESFPEVRVVRVGRTDDGLLRVGPPKLAAPRFASARAPRPTVAGSGGFLAFEGVRAEGEEAWIWIETLNAAGDPVGDPIPIIRAREAGVARRHATPIAVGARWVLAYEESADGAEPAVFVQRLAVD